MHETCQVHVAMCGCISQQLQALLFFRSSIHMIFLLVCCVLLQGDRLISQGVGGSSGGLVTAEARTRAFRAAYNRLSLMLHPDKHLALQTLVDQAHRHAAPLNTPQTGKRKRRTSAGDAVGGGGGGCGPSCGDDGDDRIAQDRTAATAAAAAAAAAAGVGGAAGAGGGNCNEARAAGTAGVAGDTPAAAAGLAANIGTTDTTTVTTVSATLKEEANRAFHLLQDARAALVLT
jgi:hypothetical protein